MALLSFILYKIYEKGYWKEFSIPTLQALIPLIGLQFYLFYISGDRLFLVINAMVIPEVILKALGYYLSKSEAK